MTHEIRPGATSLARYVDRLSRVFRGVLRIARYKRHTIRSDSYRVTVGEVEAEFGVSTREEYDDLVRLPERPILEELLSDLRPDDVVYDVGANLGLYSCLVADVVGEGVVAFEPHPTNADRLEENVSLNEADVAVRRIALAGSSGTTRLRLAPGYAPDRVGSAGHTLLTDYYGDGCESISVRKRRGDEFVATENLPAPTVLKIDTEGTEMDVLEGFDSTLARPECRLVYCEVHEERLESQGHSVSDVRTLLESHGFSVQDRSIAGYQTFLRAEKPEKPGTSGSP